ncbi:MAG: CapA family protein [Deltaproteobacteria bacterium]|nr:CapA family protein [Deltaproteobacteria bacterium]
MPLPPLPLLLALAAAPLSPSAAERPPDAGTAAAAAAPEAPPKAPAPRTLRIRAVGDVNLGSEVPEPQLPPEDGARLLAPVAPLLRDADLTFINLEGPLCDTGQSTKCPGHGKKRKKPRKRTCYAFRTPTRYGQYLADAGVDVASTANNHAGDYGESCRRTTESTLDTLGIRWSGPPGSIASLERNGLKVAVVAFYNSSATNDLNDHDAAEALVRKAKAAHDLVLVSFHGGAEGARALHVPEGREMFLGEDRGDLRRFARRVVDAGAAAVIGHGPHVPRALEVYRGRLVAYSLGNFATYGDFNLAGPNGLAPILELELAEDGTFLRGRILPARQVGEGEPQPDPSGAVIPLVQRLSREDFPATAPLIRDDGVILPRDAASATPSP